PISLLDGELTTTIWTPRDNEFSSLFNRWTNSKVIDLAAQLGGLDIMLMLHRSGIKCCTVDAMDKASAVGQLDIVKWLHNHRTEGCTYLAMTYAAARGYLHIVKWLHEVLGINCTIAGLGTTAYNGDADMELYLITIPMLLKCEHPDDILSGESSISTLISGNSLSVFCGNAVDLAASNGHINIVQILHQHPTTTEAMDKAASNGHLQMVKFLHTHRSEGCSLNGLTATARNNHFEILIYLINNKCYNGEINNKALSIASAGNNNVEILSYCLDLWQNELTPETKELLMYNAALHGSINNIKWLHESKGIGWTQPSLLRYTAQDIAIVAPFDLFTQYMPLSRLEELAESLRLLPTTAFLTLPQLQEWLGLSSSFSMYTQFLFDSLKATPESPKVFVLELLAAAAVCSTTSASLLDKVHTLCSLFTPKDMLYLKESDVAIMILSTISGLKKITVGLDEAWANFSTRELAKQLVQDVCKQGQVAREEFIEWCVTCKTTAYVLRHFIPGDLLNPSEQVTRTKQKTQKQRYEAIIKTISPEELKRMEKNAVDAARIKIQSMWKAQLERRRFLRVLNEKAADRNAAAQRIQGYSKKQKNAQFLMARAALERAAFNGAIFTFGSGLSLGEGDINGNRMVPDMISSLKAKGIKATSITMSSTTTFLTKDDGKMVVWGLRLPLWINEQVPWLVKVPTPLDLPIQIISLACGCSHALLLDEQGFVYSWGSNDHGQTGHGSPDSFNARTGQQYIKYYDPRLGQSYDYLDKPLRLPYFTGDIEQDAVAIPIAAVACGDYFSLALSTEGEVFSWGEGSDGQLGQGTSGGNLDVGFVDQRLIQTAYTFAYEPKAVLNLSNIEAISCCGNRSAALAKDHTFYEWGAWGRASVWITLSKAKTTLECFVLMAEYGRSIEAMRSESKFEMVAVDVDFDDCEEFVADIRLETLSKLSLSTIDTITGSSAASSRAEMATTELSTSSTELPINSVELVNSSAELSTSSTQLTIEPLPDDVVKSVVKSSSQTQHAINELITKLWQNRCQEVLPTAEQMYKHPQFVPLHWCRSVKTKVYNYQEILNEVLTDISGRLLLVTRSPEEGFYFQFISSNAVELEIRGLPSNTCRMITKRGIWCNFLDLTRITDTNIQLENSIVLVHFTEEDLVVKIKHLREDTIVELVTQSIAQKALALQEFGVAAIILAFDFPHTQLFEIQLPADQGIYVPILMIDMAQCNAIQNTLSPKLTTRLFYRVDHTEEIIATALNLGATGVILQQRNTQKDPRFQGDISLNDAAIYRNPFPNDDQPIVGMVSYENGQALRLAAHYDDANHLTASINFQVRDLGNIYAWGCGSNGRLGIGNVNHLEDGYDPMTESTYHYTKEPLIIPTLSGRGVCEIACGFAHTIVRTIEGRVFTWGRGHEGQLGHGTTIDYDYPKLVDRLGYENIVAVAANDTSSAVLSEVLDDISFEKRRKEINLLKAANALTSI
ncbi:regulator of chromosome condensation (RCC1), partial [Thraustotheca clavata]